MKKYNKYLLLFLYFIISTNYTAIATQLVIEKPIVIVIPSYNNKRWCERNLQSVLSQNYSNFRALYTDDCSRDGTAESVEQYLKKNDPDNKIILIKNNDRRGALHNLYSMIHSCQDEEIIVTLDGDDWFPDNNVLARLNDIYSSSKEVWLTYGQFQMHPSKAKGWATAMPDYITKNNTFRDFQHLPTHLRTFYAWLFKKIKLEDLLYQGKFYPMTWDMAMMFPMIEMAGERHQFISDIMYIYNEENNISDHHVSRQLQAHLAQVIKKKNRYKKITHDNTVVNKYDNYQADVIIFAHTPAATEQLLESLKLYVTDIDHIFVIYKPNSVTELQQYNSLANTYPEIEFCFIDEHRSNFKEVLYMLYVKTTNDHILFIKGDTLLCKALSLNNCIKALLSTPAYAFYFKLNAHDATNNYKDMPLIELSDNIFAWNFSLARDKWSSANSFDSVLHQKTDSLSAALQNYYDLTPNGLESVWANEGNLDRLGLCFNESYTTKEIVT